MTDTIPPSFTNVQRLVVVRNDTGGFKAMGATVQDFGTVKTLMHVEDLGALKRALGRFGFVHLSGYVGGGSNDTGAEKWGLTKITAIIPACKFSHEPIKDVPVINPGGWFGAAKIVEVGGSAFPLFFVVEADSYGDAVDEFSGSDDYGHHVVIEDSAKGDYGEEVSEEDANRAMTWDDKAEGWVDDKNNLWNNRPKWRDLNGKWYAERPSCASEPHYNDGGVPCDLDNVMVHGPEGRNKPFPGLLYCGIYEGRPLPAEGVTPKQFEDITNWRADNWEPAIEGQEDCYVEDIAHRDVWGSLPTDAVRLFRHDGKITEVLFCEDGEVVKGDVPQVLKNAVIAFVS